MHTGTLVMMTRRPEPGRTKSRLIPCLGAARSAELAAAFLADLLERFQGFPAARRVLAWADEGSRAGSEDKLAAPPGWEATQQTGANLGSRLLELYRRLESPVVFMGSDAPTLPARAVRAAFLALEEDFEGVFQPALDGGFTLGGFQRDPGALFSGVSWGGGAVLATILQTASRESWRVGLLDPWYDVDVEADLLRLRFQLELLKGTDAFPARTARMLERLEEQEA